MIYFYDIYTDGTSHFLVFYVVHRIVVAETDRA